MRVIATLVLLMVEELALVEALAQRHHPLAFCEISEEVLKLCFKVQAVPDDSAGSGHAHDVTSGLPIKVGIHTWAHKAFDVDALSPDLAHSISDHAGCRDDVEFPRLLSPQ